MTHLLLLQDRQLLNYVMSQSMINCINTASALLSRYAANTAHRKLNVQTPTEAKSGGPKL